MIKSINRIVKIGSLVAIVGGSASVCLANQAKACTCFPPEVTSSYSNHSDVFFAKVFFELITSKNRFYWTEVKRTFKGCLQKGETVVLKTPISSAACGADLDSGETYLINGQSTASDWIKAISLCGFNVPVSQLEGPDKEFLNGRTVCCGDSCTCADGTLPVNCLVDPCEVAPPCPEGTCVANYCGGCNAEFFNDFGQLVCEEQSCASDDDCRQGSYCSSFGICLDDGSCDIHVDCNLPGNTYPHIECVGYGVCEDDRSCGWECDDPNCVDYAGFDFGPCDAVLGWGVVDGSCVEISGCEAPLGDLFASESECSSVCDEQ